MLMRVPFRKDSRLSRNQCLIPRRLQEAATYLVDVCEPLYFANGYFVGRDADHGTIFLVEAVDIVDAPSGDDMELQDEVGKAAMPWPRDRPKSARREARVECAEDGVANEAKEKELDDGHLPA